MISCQVSLYPLGTPEYTKIIKEALASLPEGKLQVEVNPMSTIIRGDEEEVWQAAQALFKAASQAGEAVMVMTISNRCGCR